MRKLILTSALALPACNLTPAQIQADQAKALYYLQAAGCINEAVVNTASAIAAPIVATQAGPAGSVVLGLVDGAVNEAATASNGGQPCTVTVPASAVAPAPAPAVAPAPKS
jgi:hypothetical protein